MPQTPLAGFPRACGEQQTIAAACCSSFRSFPRVLGKLLYNPLSIKTFKTTERSGDNPQIENPGLKARRIS